MENGGSQSEECKADFVILIKRERIEQKANCGVVGEMKENKGKQLQKWSN